MQLSDQYGYLVGRLIASRAPEVHSLEVAEHAMTEFLLSIALVSLLATPAESGISAEDLLPPRASWESMSRLLIAAEDPPRETPAEASGLRRTPLNRFQMALMKLV